MTHHGAKGWPYSFPIFTLARRASMFALASFLIESPCFLKMPILAEIYIANSDVKVDNPPKWLPHERLLLIVFP